MAYDLEEQEQLDELKAWWKQYGKLVILVLAAFFASLAAFQGWRYYRNTQAQAAVTLYGQLEQADQAGDGKKARAIAAQIVDKYGSTAYAVLASLVAARHAFAGGDLADAKARLQWVTEKAREEEIRDLARLRLAAVLLDEKKYAEALKLVETKPVDAMSGLYADLKGDIFLAQGKVPEARRAYQSALDKSEANSPYRATLQLKLDSLGESR